MDVVRGLIYIVGCPHHWDDASAGDDGSGGSSVGGGGGGSGIGGDGDGVTRAVFDLPEEAAKLKAWREGGAAFDGLATEAAASRAWRGADSGFDEFTAKLGRIQRLEGHHFRAELLHFPSLQTPKEARAAAEAASAAASAKVLNTRFDLSAEAAHALAAEAAQQAAQAATTPTFERRPVTVKGAPVSKLVPVLGVSNEAWQLLPAPPPGRYLLRITTNPRLNKDLHSPSCFHAVVAA